MCVGDPGCFNAWIVGSHCLRRSPHGVFVFGVLGGMCLMWDVCCEDEYKNNYMSAITER